MLLDVVSAVVSDAVAVLVVDVKLAGQKRIVVVTVHALHNEVEIADLLFLLVFYRNAVVARERHDDIEVFVEDKLIVSADFVRDRQTVACVRKAVFEIGRSRNACLVAVIIVVLHIQKNFVGVFGVRFRLIVVGSVNSARKHVVIETVIIGVFLVLFHRPVLVDKELAAAHIRDLAVIIVFIVVGNRTVCGCNRGLSRRRLRCGHGEDKVTRRVARYRDVLSVEAFDVCKRAFGVFKACDEHASVFQIAACRSTIYRGITAHAALVV